MSDPDPDPDPDPVAWPTVIVDSLRIEISDSLSITVKSEKPTASDLADEDAAP